jgi:hypothetical protein
MVSLFRSLLRLALTGCATLPRPPDWYAEGAPCERALPEGGRRYCASALGDDAEAARATAVNLALDHAARELSTELQSRLEVDSSCVSVDGTGRVSTECRETVRQGVRSETKRLAFRQVAVERLLGSREAGRQRAWVAVKIPADEWGRLVRTARGTTFVAVDCRQGTERCSPAVLDGVVAALAACRIKGSAGLVTDASEVAEVQRRALEAGAARALHLSLRASERTREGSLVVAESGGRWELFDTTDRSQLAARSIPTRTEATLELATSLERSLRKTVGRLSEISCGSSDAQGSFCCAQLENLGPP